MLSFRQLEVFRSVMISGSISAASQHLNIAQPTVTNTIRRLEDVLKVRLFNRSGARLIPTRTAQQIFEVVQPSISALEQLSVTVQEIAAGQHVMFRLGVSPSVSQALAPKALAHLARLNPGARLRMDTLSLKQIKDYLWLAEGDFAVTIFPINDPIIVSRQIASISMVCLVPEDHPLAQRDSVTLQDIAEERLIFFHPNTPHGKKLKEMFRAQNIKPHITIETRFAESAISLMYENFGIAIVDELTGRAVRHDGIRAVSIEGVPSLPVLLHHHKDHGSKTVLDMALKCLLLASEELGLDAPK
ncbi:MAG: LysR family transcriptional regulator [Rhizobiaceae bacterium]|jgi:DNA-binding transcriptional LysR family regulator|nr:LysR family transcriptional regulator [Rhizobiaceae bacterium]